MIKEKKFQYDVLLDRENICNLKRESVRINQGIENGEKMVVYGKRNMGKTSLIKSVIVPDFKRKHPRSFVFFADLMEVKDMPSLVNRLRLAFEESFKDSFPGKALFEEVKNLLKGINFSFTVDPLSGEPSFSISPGKGERNDNLTVESIFKLIQKNLLGKIPGLIILDEFQDITFVDEAEGVFRNALQKLGSTPVILMGSKKHILTKMFSNPSAPFADFGSDIEFQEIPFEEYHQYIQERFKSKKLEISLEDSTYWQELLFRSPEPINIVGSYLVDNNQNKKIIKQDILAAITAIIRQRRSRYEGILGNLSANQEKVMVAMAKSIVVPYPAGKDFLAKVSLSNATATKIVEELNDRSLVESTPDGYKVASPILYFYLRLFR
jgi:uncharacterized protein